MMRRSSKPMRRVSARRENEEADYRKLTAEVRAETGGICEVGPLIETAPDVERRGWRCSGRQQSLHHLRKLSDAGAYVLRANVVGACLTCNGWVEDHPDAAHDLGLVVRPGDPGYELLGVRAARRAAIDRD